MGINDSYIPEEGTSVVHSSRREESRALRFDSLFGKYISAFLLILLASFLVLALIITGVLGSYARNSKRIMAQSALSETLIYVEDGFRSEASEDLASFLQANRREMTALLSALCDSLDSDMTVFFTDAEANVLFCVAKDGVQTVTGLKIPKEMLTDVLNGIEISSVAMIDGLISNQHLVRAAAIHDEGGRVVGAVFACAGSGTFDRLLDTVMELIFFASIAMLLIALIAVYVITERVIGPLRQMSRAAKSYASGNFEVVVPVKGRDEVAELAEAFNQMATSLKNLEKMRSTFMANVSHDLRTPMTTIAGFIDSILAGAIPPEKHAHYLGIVAVEVKRLSRLVSLTLDISRIQAGDRKFVMAQFDICETARLILISFEQKIEEKHLDVSFDADDDNMTVYADRDAIYQILYNICDNAVKFSNEGGRLEIAIRAQREKKKVQVTVLNEGPGIPEEDIPYVFDQFYKGDKSRGLDKSGVGLGMFISKAIIDAHKEEIWVDSEYGKNCEFGFTLSAKPPHRESQ